MSDDDEKTISASSPQSKSRRNRATQEDIIKFNTVKKRCIIRSRKYTLKDLNSLRNISSNRIMPINIIYSIPELLSPGLGLKIHPKCSLSTQIINRNKQIEIAKQIKGYKNYIKLILKSERINNIHPSTPTYDDIILSSKRRFSSNLKIWKKELHSYDHINNQSEIPHHLLTNNMKKERYLLSINPPHLNSIINSNIYHKWSPKKTPTTPQSTKSTKSTQSTTTTNKNNDNNNNNIKRKLIFIDATNSRSNSPNKKPIYSPSYYIFILLYHFVFLYILSMHYFC